MVFTATVKAAHSCFILVVLGTFFYTKDLFFNRNLFLQSQIFFVDLWWSLLELLVIIPTFSGPFLLTQLFFKQVWFCLLFSTFTEIIDYFSCNLGSISWIPVTLLGTLGDKSCYLCSMNATLNKQIFTLGTFWSFPLIYLLYIYRFQSCHYRPHIVESQSP